jgi:hypothetical protein
MMRRGFWLVTGAVLGVTGYRKATRLARTITGSPVPSRSLTPAPGTAASGPRAVSSGPRAVASGPRAVPSAPPAQVPSASRALGTAALRLGPAAFRQARSAAGFARDVRDGMADYRDLHGRQLGRSLGSRSPQQPAGRAASGRSRRGSIEP